MHQAKFYSNKPHVKSAEIVGNVLGSLHPHGDSSVYDAMVRLTQDFALNVPLVDGHGNYGNIDGDPAAHYRYSQARLSEAGEAILLDIDEGTVDWKKNFSETQLEPVVLPSRLPNLLVNGSTGIAVGMAASFVPGNLKEIVASIEATMKNPDISIEDLLKISGGPDFPTGGLVINQEELLEGYKTGRGRVRTRAEYTIQDSKGRQSITFHSIPYAIRKVKLIEDMVKAVNNGDVEGVVDIRDESTRDIAIVVDVHRDSDPTMVVESLFSNTQLEHTYSINNTCLVNGEPKTLSFKSLIEHYIEFQREVLTRRSNHSLEKVLERLERIAGVLLALEDLDKTIEFIRQSDSTQEARAKLVARLGINEEQANYVLGMQLSRLTRLESVELRREQEKLQESELYLTKLIEDKTALDKLLLKELKEIAEPFYSKRKTKITQLNKAEIQASIRDVVVESVNVGIDYRGDIRLMTDRQFAHESNIKKNRFQLALTNDEALLVLTTEGIIHRVLVEDLEDGSNLSRVIPLNPTESILTILTSLKSEFVLLATEQGMVKKTLVEDYLSIGRTGTAAIKLRQGDRVIGATGIDQEQIILMTQTGQAIRFDTKDIRATGRNTLGVNGIKLEAGDNVVSLTTVQSNKDSLVLLTSDGYARQLHALEVPTQGRAGKGVRLGKGDNSDFLALSNYPSENIDTIKIFKGAREEDHSLDKLSEKKLEKIVEGDGITEMFLY